MLSIDCVLRALVCRVRSLVTPHLHVDRAETPLLALCTPKRAYKHDAFFLELADPTSQRSPSVKMQLDHQQAQCARSYSLGYRSHPKDGLRIEESIT